MPRIERPRHVTAIAADLRDVIECLRGLGIDLDRGRIEAYLDVLDSAARGDAVDTALLWAAACEVSDLVAASTLSRDALQPVVARLSRICDGDPVFTSRS